jgi:hypothetical protein
MGRATDQVGAPGAGSPTAAHPGAATERRRLANRPVIERTWTADREAMAAALRVVLGLPKVLPSPAGGGKAA